MAIQQPVVGGTYDWYLNATINSEAAPGVFGAWDLNAASATVTISFVPPSGSGLHFTATLLSIVGAARYINASSLFNASGQWAVSWKVTTPAGQVLETQETTFTVYPSGAAT